MNVFLHEQSPSVADEAWRWKKKAFYKVGDCMLTENQFMFDKLYYKWFCDSNYFENEMLKDKAVHIQLQHTTNIQPHMSVWKPSGIRAPDFLAIKEPCAYTSDTKPLITPSNASPRCSSWISWAMEEESLVHFSCVSDINVPEEKGESDDVITFSCISTGIQRLDSWMSTDKNMLLSDQDMWHGPALTHSLASFPPPPFVCM